MSNYTIQSTALNKSRVFILQKSELEKRFDAQFYKPEILSKIARIRTLENVTELKKIYTNISTGFNNETKFNENGTKFLRTQNIRPIELDITNTLFTNDDNLRITNFGDLLFTRIGVGVGDVAYNDKGNFAISDNVICVNLKDPTIGKFIAIFLNSELGKVLLEREKRDTARAIISYENILNLPIPLLNEDKRTRIINIYQKFLSQKQRNEAEAEKLLSSIDDYLLNELGIKLPEPPENILKNRVFTVSITELSGNRYDPNYHQKYFQDVFSAFEKGKYEYSQIRKFASFQAGYAFKSSDYLEHSNCLLITIKNIRQNQIDIKDTTYLPDDFFEQYKEFQIRNNDLLIAMTGATIGKVGIYNHPNNSLLNQGNGIIKPDNINSIYLMCLLNLSIFQKLILRNSNGSVQSNIRETDIMRISIPVPPIDKQKEIAEHITVIRQQAQQLKDKTKDDLKKAGEEIEKILLN